MKTVATIEDLVRTKQGSYKIEDSYTLDDIKPVKMMVRLSDKDKYGRYLAEVVNPKTGKDVGFEASNNPELNASFDLYNTPEFCIYVSL